jgi:hypothetical protein
MSSNESDFDPANVLRVTHSVVSEPGDAVDSADRLTMIMEAEAIRNSLSGNTGEYGGEGSLDGLLYPLEDIEDVLAIEDADEVNTPRIDSAEVAAMHYIDSDEYVTDETLLGVDAFDR